MAETATGNDTEEASAHTPSRFCSRNPLQATPYKDVAPGEMRDVGRGLFSGLRPQEAGLFGSVGLPASSAPPLSGSMDLSPTAYCPDINECEEDGVECGPGQMCFNTRGSYQCVDTPCPAAYRQGSNPG